MIANKTVGAGVLAIAIALVLSACGSSSEPATSTAATSTTAAAIIATKPTVTVPNSPAPTTLQVTDLQVGTGATAKTGDSVSVQYVGVAYSTKKQFDASWDHPGAAPYPFTIGQGDVISGWDQGVAGMKVGGRRQLVIPPSLGYGADGRPPVIAPNETLIFVIDLVSVTSPSG